MLPWYHLHSNVKTFLIRPITGSSVVSYYCSLVQKRCLEATFCHCLAKTPSSLWVSLSVGGLLHTPLPHYIITDNFSENGGGCQGVSGFSVGRQHRNYFMFCGRFRYDKRAEVSICKLRKSDTCVFALTPRKFFPVPDSIFSRSAMLSSLSARYPGATLIYLYQYIFVSVAARNR